MIEIVPEKEEILKVENLKMYFPVTKGLLKRKVGDVKAVDDVSFTVNKGETLGIVGESGSGKSTIGNCVMRNLNITSGTITYKGRDISYMKNEELRAVHSKLQMITQNPFESLDPRMTVLDIIMEGPRIRNSARSIYEQTAYTKELLEKVGLNPEYIDRYPHEFSGGQRQRISIARSLAMQPEFIVCDEIVSALDVSIQAQIVKLMMRLQEEYNMSYIFIGHDLSVVRYLSDNIAVMYLGKIMEYTNAETLYDNPLHPYTQALISAVPIPDPVVDRERKRILLEGEVPSPINPPKGCNFCTRCPYATEECREAEPEYKEVEEGHFVACHRVKKGGA